MNRVKVPSGSKQKLETIFDNLQDFTSTNLVARSELIFESYGALNKTNASSETATTTALKVEENTSPGFMTRFTIKAGTGLAKNGEHVQNPSTATEDLSNLIDSLTISRHYLIYLQLTETGTESIPAMSSFLYDPTGTGQYSQKYSAYEDSYEIKAVLIPIASTTYITDLDTDSIPLAVVKTDVSNELDLTGWAHDGRTAVNGVVDLRGEVSLKISEEVLPDNLLVFKDRDSVGTQKVNATVEFNQVRAPEYTGISGWMYVLDSVSAKLLSYDLTNDRIGVNKETPEVTVDIVGNMKVDGDSDVTGNTTVSGNSAVGGILTVTGGITSDGRDVMLHPLSISGLAPGVLNFRIEEVTTPKHIPVKSTFEAKMADKPEARLFSNNLTVFLKWNYADIIGTGGVNTFTITNTNWSFSENELANYFLYLPSESQTNLAIISNTATVADTCVLTVENIDGSSWNGTGVTVSAPDPGWIHSNATKYEIIAVPIINSAYSWSDGEEYTIRAWKNNDLYPVMQRKVKLPTGREYEYQIRAVGLNSKTPWATYPGTGNGTLVEHSDITNDGSLATEATRYGFSVTIAGWTEADAYEICWAAGATPDFKNPNHETLLTTNSYEEIRTSISTAYNVRARPLVGGQQVCPDATISGLQNTVVSGGDSALPQDQVIVDTDIEHIVITSTTSSYGGNELTLATTVDTPAGLTGKTTSSLSEKTLIGRIATDTSSNDFIIRDKKNNILLLDNPGTPPAGSGAVEIGTSLRGRRVYRSKEFSIDYELVQIAVECESIVGTSVTMRIYQEGKSDLADIITITESDTPYVVESDVRLLALYGSRNLIIDLWDPSVGSPVNNSSFKGHVTVYARPKPPKRVLDYKIDKQS